MYVSQRAGSYRKRSGLSEAAPGLAWVVGRPQWFGVDYKSINIQNVLTNVYLYILTLRAKMYMETLRVRTPFSQGFPLALHGLLDDHCSLGLAAQKI